MSEEKPKKNAINNVVTDLIRAAAGSSAKNVSDADVDKYVADLILKEAQEKRQKYNVVGVKAYQPNGFIDKPKPKPNTRFLLNMVKATDSHNQAVIKANEDNVAKLRKERLEREAKCKRVKEIEEKHKEERRKHRLSIDDYNKKRKSHSNEEEEEEHRRDRKKHKKKSSSSSSSSSRRHHHHHSSTTHNDTPKEIQYKGRGKVKINVSSMDKYFAKGYDPLLDVDSDKEDDYIFAKEPKKHKKKKKSHKHRDMPSSSSSSSEEEEEEPQKQVRAWDIGKV